MLISSWSWTGTIKQLEVFHTAPEPWFIAEVLVLNESTGVIGIFQANRWGDKFTIQATVVVISLWFLSVGSTPCCISRLILPNTPTILDATALPPVDYRVEVKTSDRFKAGTSAKVFCNLYGLQGSTGR